MIKLEMIWHDGTKEKPENNGTYITITAAGFKTSLEYAEGYWNAHIDFNGVLQKDHAIEDIQWWAEFPEPPQRSEDDA